MGPQNGAVRKLGKTTGKPRLGCLCALLQEKNRIARYLSQASIGPPLTGELFRERRITRCLPLDVVSSNEFAHVIKKNRISKGRRYRYRREWSAANKTVMFYLIQTEYTKANQD